MNEIQVKINILIKWIAIYIDYYIYIYINKINEIRYYATKSKFIKIYDTKIDILNMLKNVLNIENLISILQSYQ